MNLYPCQQNKAPKSSLKGFQITFVLAFMVIVSISPLHASAEEDKCSNPGPDLVNFNPEIPPRPSPVYSFFDERDAELSILDYKGQGVVLNFWATWCVPCIKEMPALINLKALLSEDNITVLALSEDRGGAAKVISFFKKLGIKNLEVLIDKRGKVARKSGVRGLPVTIFIDAEGFERGRVIGIAKWDSKDIVDFIRRCIGTKNTS
jgi:thiol-disulfide isomerase/thioredoxin